MKLRIFVTAVLAVSGLAVVPASAIQCPNSVDDASAESPHADDLTNDWSGVATGNEAGTTPFGDLYREGVDLTAAWISRSGDTLTANVQVRNLALVQPNTIFYFLWDYPGEYTNPNSGVMQDATRRFVTARLKGTETVYQWGYFGPATTPTSSGTYVTVGDTTGSLTEGPDGVVSIVIPKGDFPLGSADGWGTPAPDSILDNVEARSSFLVGSPQQLPPNPSGLRYGFTYQMDITDNETCIANV